MKRIDSQRRKEFSGFTLADALQIIGQDDLALWEPEAVEIPTSAFFEERMERMQLFDMTLSEMARQILIEAIFEEAGQPFKHLKIFKSVSLEGKEAGGFVDYLIAPSRLLPRTPLLCVAEAKKDDFERGMAQCLAEMHVCARQNEAEETATTVYGIVSNGATWQFFKRTPDGQYIRSGIYAITALPLLLGVLTHIFEDCDHIAQQRLQKIF